LIRDDRTSQDKLAFFNYETSNIEHIPLTVNLGQDRGDENNIIVYLTDPF
jgi:hypothetical protein